VYFLKNSEVKDNFKAKGLDKAKEKLRYENLSEEDKKMYDRFQENRRIEISVEYTAKLEAKQEEKIEVAKNLISLGSNNEFIVKATGLTVEQIEQLRNSKQ
jgi:predicted transposase/invertase (TIGR01784 family)